MKRFLAIEPALPVEWRVFSGVSPYEDMVAAMEARAEAIYKGEAREAVWLVEHAPLYTAGTSARAEDLRDTRFPIHKTGRGGQYTYHGPGQRVAYVMLNLNKRRQDVRAFVTALEDWLILSLDAFNVKGEVRADRVGVWVARPEAGAGREDKIAAIGIRLRRWVSFHGVALNVEPELSHFGGIVPCGIHEQKYGVTSLVDLGLPLTMDEVDEAMRCAFQEVFGDVARG